MNRYFNFYVREFVYILYKSKDMNLRDFWKEKFGVLKAKCGEICCVGKHGLIIPYNAAVCERGFSEQNRHITKARPNISTSLLRDLLMICLEGPEFGTARFFNVIERAMKIWELSKSKSKSSSFSYLIFVYILNDITHIFTFYQKNHQSVSSSQFFT